MPTVKFNDKMLSHGVVRKMSHDNNTFFFGRLRHVGETDPHATSVLTERRCVCVRIGCAGSVGVCEGGSEGGGFGGSGPETLEDGPQAGQVGYHTRVCTGYLEVP